MGKIMGIIGGVIVLLVAGVVALFAFSGNTAEDESNPLSSAVNDAKVTATNAAIDASGIKSTIQEAVENHKDSIAAATGMSATQVDEAVANLDIDNWQAATLPSTATETGTIDGASLGVDGTITTYDDPGYITVNAYGQSITMSVPESAQQYLPLVEYL